MLIQGNGQSKSEGSDKAEVTSANVVDSDEAKVIAENVNSLVTNIANLLDENAQLIPEPLEY